MGEAAVRATTRISQELVRDFQQKGRVDASGKRHEHSLLLAQNLGRVVRISGPFFVAEKIGAQIMFAFVREDRDHDVTGLPRLFTTLERSAACRARRDPDQQTSSAAKRRV